MQFDKSEMDRLRQWFDALSDVNPEFLDIADFDLGSRLYEACGMKTSAWITDRMTKSET